MTRVTSTPPLQPKKTSGRSPALLLEDRGIQVVPAGPGLQAARPGNLQRDGIHLTARGHEIVAETLLPRVIEALR